MEVRSYQATLKLRDLVPGEYPIVCLRKINGKYGEFIIAKINVNGVEEEYYLTKYIVNQISNIDEYENGLLIYRGIKHDRYYDYILRKSV